MGRLSEEFVRSRWREFARTLGVPVVRDFYEWDEQCLRRLPEILRREYEAYALALSGEAGEEAAGGDERIRARARELARTGGLEGHFYRFLLTSPSLRATAIAGRLRLYECVLPDVVARLSRHTTLNRVLDVGSFAGVVSCFLASLLPQASVIGLEMEAGWVAEAKRLSEQLGLKNVEFLQGEWQDFTPESPADAVVWLLVQMITARIASKVTRFLARALSPGGAAAIVERWENEAALSRFEEACGEVGLTVAETWTAWWQTPAELDVPQKTRALIVRRAAASTGG